MMQLNIKKAFVYLPILPALLGVFNPANVHAQSEYKFPVSWESKPAVHNIADKWKKQSAAIVLDQRRLEYRQDDKKEIYVYRTIHRIISLIDDKGVESFNKFTIPLGKERKIVAIKARAILKNGKVINVEQSAIKTTKAEDGNEQYLFAMDGVEKGAEVEVLYTEKKPFSVFGLETFQTVIPVLTADFSVIVPENLTFDFAGYNGFPKAKDSLTNSVHFYHSTSKEIPGLEEEEYANRDANEQRIDFKLSYVKSDETPTRRFTWSELVKDMYEKYETFTDKERRIADKYLANLGVTDEDDAQKKIQRIEDGMKTSINISEDIPDESYEAFDKIIDKKLTTEKGFARLMAACLSQAGIQHEFGLTSSRYTHVVDEDLELWSTLGEFVIYFPKQKMYMAPTAITYRAPYIPYGILSNKGIFCKVTSIGTLTSAVPDIQTINPLPVEKSGSGVDAVITFNTEMTPQVNITHTYYGFPAASLRPVFLFIGKDKEKEMIVDLIGIKSKEDDITDYKIEHSAYKNYYTNKPLKMNVTLQAPQLMEKAGPKYLFSIGSIIGRQQEMYKDEERKQPIDVNYCHSLPRTIRVTIPQGYKIANPDALRINITDKDNEGKETMGFTSDYKIEGDVLEVRILEYYGQLNYPISAYPTFRKVINAAADFNKVVLVFQKV